ncbi:MAG: ERF family protein [Bacteroidaceae bacterium]|nr:ERF family protein [Bacteroidaceae bacterium]
MESYSSQEITELAKALIAVQRDMAPATKDATNPFCKNKYATLNSVMEACRAALLHHGIWLTQLPVPAPSELAQGHIGLLTKLTHAESGQWQSSLAVVPLPKADPQGMGSAITYARRYALTAMLGMVTEDDDCNAASINPQMPSKTATRARRPVNATQTQNTPYREQTQAASQNLASNRTLEALENLPQLEGIAYQIVQSQDGRDCIIATGNTLKNKEVLIGYGFRWHPQQKFWWKYADAS